VAQELGLRRAHVEDDLRKAMQQQGARGLAEHVIRMRTALELAGLHAANAY
jgi:hypothetical protein